MVPARQLLEVRQAVFRVALDYCRHVAVHKRRQEKKHGRRRGDPCMETHHHYWNKIGLAPQILGGRSIGGTALIVSRAALFVAVSFYA